MQYHLLVIVHGIDPFCRGCVVVVWAIIGCMEFFDSRVVVMWIPGVG